MKFCIFCGKRVESFNVRCKECNESPKQDNGFFCFSSELGELCGGFNVDCFAYLSQIEPQNFWFRYRNRLILWCIQKYFHNCKTFFEIGCGTGFVLSAIENEFPHMELCGSDIFTQGLIYASKRIKKAELFQMDARKMPFQEEFDVIGAFDVLEHIEEDTAVLSQMCNALRSNGGIILTVPQHEFMWGPADEHAHHVRRYSASELKSKVEKAGFKVTRVTSFMSLLFPIMVISRLKDKIMKESYEHMNEFRIHALVNKAFDNLLKMEEAYIKSGLNSHFGGSLLLIARKI